MKHPARTMPFEKLWNGLHAAIERGHVRKTIKGELHLFTYSESVVYERAWDEFSMMARGLIIDASRNEVVASPFTKFFNVGEGISTIPDLPFETFEKLDGSLIIIFWHDGEWRTGTKGSLNSEQSRWAAERIASMDMSAFTAGTAYFREAIYDSNRIVVHYDYEGLVLLGGYHVDGTELLAEDLTILGKASGLRVATRRHYANVSDLLSITKSLPRTEEGYVLRFANGLRLKVKGDEYCRIHRLVSNLTPLSIWESMLKGDDLESVRRELPEEFWDDFDQIRGILQAHADDLTARVRESAEKTIGMTDKEVGLSLGSFPTDISRFIFPWRKSGGDLLTGRTREFFFKQLRPTGNVLEGYIPSRSINRVFEEAA